MKVIELEGHVRREMGGGGKGGETASRGEKRRAGGEGDAGDDGEDDADEEKRRSSEVCRETLDGVWGLWVYGRVSALRRQVTVYYPELLLFCV